MILCVVGDALALYHSAYQGCTLGRIRLILVGDRPVKLSVTKDTL